MLSDLAEAELWRIFLCSGCSDGLPQGPAFRLTANQADMAARPPSTPQSPPRLSRTLSPILSPTTVSSYAVSNDPINVPLFFWHAASRQPRARGRARPGTRSNIHWEESERTSRPAQTDYNSLKMDRGQALYAPQSSKTDP
ncbi:hypothetical protein DPEC_G00340560 [Dallia pectoralis]|uniref:Uncharacterized protein n=1 Tax=Dallia pectoralis TaxID=75939 RepID=A0ACC2F581_DALPE|nr:hypothetical protein DPEC_G00340560 [Dallia pectoralis]